MSDMSTYAGQTEHYAAVRARLGRPVPKSLRRVRPEPDRDFLIVSTALIEEPKPEAGLVQLPPWRIILREVSRKHGIPVHILTGRQRSKPVVIARHEAMYRMAHETRMSLPQIAKRLGLFDHSTVCHGVGRHAERNGLVAFNGGGKPNYLAKVQRAGVVYTVPSEKHNMVKNDLTSHAETATA